MKLHQEKGALTDQKIEIDNAMAVTLLAQRIFDEVKALSMGDLVSVRVGCFSYLYSFYCRRPIKKMGWKLTGRELTDLNKTFQINLFKRKRS
ncbi:hypothetical protein [Enterococcus malodoratus]|uniref:hypothetical protein n=1 Tax=Enterococcus malodoratus TaxID=71451 RepID=UPI0039B10476